MPQEDTAIDFLKYIHDSLIKINPIEDDTEHVVDRLIDITDEISVFLDTHYGDTTPCKDRAL